MYTTLATEKRNHTLIITLNRPDKLNALNQDLLKELKEVIDNLQEDADILGAIITGAGDKAFAAGADIQEFIGLSEEQAAEVSRFGQQVFFAIENSHKPIIAAINGYALGGGCELAMACHMRIAAEGARFGQPEVKLGLLAGYGGTQRLAQLIGKGKATELLITGDQINAEEAYRLRLVNYVTTRGELLDKCLEILAKACKQSPLAIRHTLNAINAGYQNRNGYANRNGYEVEAECFGKAIVSEDGKEGTTAFLEKRKPAFSGK
ncbi:enoyl-CoA hydratase-related protein [Pontibacter sp. G13]|uniref:enoyl-CoA hydratase/isomerase family protein n=1 Tax=Pontibacter sp. G13 TaxID=3074898 RepID=UPI002889CFEC|nr:enoyl-CoA hydratase-related protein [Pontibacter sp. G13]WNJ17277.1 enoyl-CoA hydratase-related protein [Pontibacter sp. G13]